MKIMLLALFVLLTVEAQTKKGQAPKAATPARIPSEGDTVEVTTSLFCGSTEYAEARAVSFGAKGDYESLGALTEKGEVFPVSKGNRGLFLIVGNSKVFAVIKLTSGKYLDRDCWLPKQILRVAVPKQ